MAFIVIVIAVFASVSGIMAKEFVVAVAEAFVTVPANVSGIGSDATIMVVTMFALEFSAAIAMFASVSGTMSAVTMTGTVFIVVVIAVSGITVTVFAL